MKTILAILTLVITACGENQPTHGPILDKAPIQGTPPAVPAEDMGIYVQQFYDQAKEHGIPHPEVMISRIYFVDEKWSENEIGNCLSYMVIIDGKNLGIAGKNEIKILRSFWDKSTGLTRKALITHELAHCILGLEHSEVADDVMSPVMSYDYINGIPGFNEAVFDEGRKHMWAMPKEEMYLNGGKETTRSID